MVHIKILGLGCARCAKLARRADSAAQQMGLEYRLEKVQDLARILEAGGAVPALVIGGTVWAAGRVPAEDEIRAALAAYARNTESQAAAP